MELKLLNTSYTNPLTNESFTDTIFVDGVFSDDPINKKLTQSFRIQRNVIAKNFIVGLDGNQSIQKIKSTQVVSEVSLIFNEDSHEDSFVIIDNERNELFEFLKSGGKLSEVEKIQVGYPNYTEVKGYFFKDNIGDRVEINPTLDGIGRLLAEKFVLDRILANGEPIGKQFKF